MFNGHCDLWEIFILHWNECPINGIGRGGEFVDVMMCLIFSLTDMLVVRSECCVETCRLTSIQCY